MSDLQFVADVRLNALTKRANPLLTVGHDFCDLLALLWRKPHLSVKQLDEVSILI